MTDVEMPATGTKETAEHPPSQARQHRRKQVLRHLQDALNEIAEEENLGMDPDSA